MEIQPIVTALVGPISALTGIAVGYQLQNRVRRRERVLDAVLKALALARQYQWDLMECASALDCIDDEAEVPEGEDPDAFRKFNLDFSLRRFEDARRRVFDIEKELRLAGVPLACLTTLHRQKDADTVTGYDTIVDEVCGHSFEEITRGGAEFSDFIFRYGILLAMFENESIEYLKKNVDKKIVLPESIAMGTPMRADNNDQADG